MEELTKEQQDLLAERLDFLKHKRSKLKEIKTIYQWEEARELIGFTLAQEEGFREEHRNYKDIIIVGLKRANNKIKSAVELIIKNKTQQACDPYFDGINDLIIDYDRTIRQIEEKEHLWQFFQDKDNAELST